MNKFAKLFLATAFIFASSSLFAGEVNEDEIKSVSDQTIVFENYTGPHQKIDTLDQIKAIGSGIAEGFNKDKAGNYGKDSRYYVIHSVSDENSGKLDADIFVIGSTAGVDHIRNLRHIVASYLSQAYGYAYDDAYTIATFVTVYNAVYRGKLDYFQSKYKSDVLKNLSQNKAGIAISYKEWPGATQMVIPLGDLNGGLSTVDTSVISDKKVVDSMREEDDKGIDERKNMVDIKEREAEQAAEKAQEAQKSAAEEEKQLQEEKKELADKKDNASKKETQATEAQKKADEAQKKADDAKKTADENPKDAEAQKDAQQAQKEADTAKKEAVEAQKDAEEAKKDVEEQEKVVKEQQEKTDEAKKEAADEQAVADKKNTEAQDERTQIAQDQKEVIKQSVLEETTAIYALKVVDTSNLYSAIVKVNRLTGEELKTSPVKVIRNRTVYPAGNNFIAIAGESGKKSAVKLVQIDKTNLDIVKESEEVIADNSVLVQAGSDYLAVVNKNGKNYLGKFNSELECKATSNVEVNPATPVVPCAEGYCVTDTNGKVIILNMSDLTKKEQTTAGKAVDTIKAATNDR
ncbi:MAG: P83/100 family protein [Treponema sp.]|nr:P83/100 family protein [Treponema sp.]